MYESTERLRLREQRDRLPVVLGRDDFRIENIQSYLEICRNEVNDTPIRSRLPHRVIIRVDEVRRDLGPPRIDAVISSWSPDHAVSIPAACISEEIIEKLCEGTYLLGDVNIGAESEEELFFKNIDEIVETSIEL